MLEPQNCYAETTLAENRASPYLSSHRRCCRERGDRPVKILIAVAALAGSVSMLLTDWAGQGVAYL